MSTKQFINKSLYAGILIGIGDIVYLSLDNKILAATLFSLGLLTVINQGLNLYTGKIGYHNLSILEYITVFICNFVGIAITTFLGFISKSSIFENAVSISQVKFNHQWYELLILGIFCGMCMYIAVSNKNTIMTIIAIMVFILCGFEHCIADVPYFLLNLSCNNVLKFAMIVLGNSIGSILLHELGKSI